MKLENLFINQRQVINNKQINNNYNTNSVSNKQIKSISDFPKGYIKLEPSFKGLSIEEQRKAELQDKIDQDKKDYLWAKSWNREEAKKNYEIKTQKEYEIKNQKTFSWIISPSKELIEDENDWLFEEEERKHNEIMKSEDYYKNLLAQDIIKRPIPTTEIMANTRGSLNTKIAGYSYLKDQLALSFITPIRKEAMQGGEEKVANSILLCGPTGCGKTVAAEAVANETKCNVIKIPTSTNTDEFAEIVDDSLKDSIKYYDDTLAKNQEIKNSEEFKNLSEEEQQKKLSEMPSPRTVIIVDEIDRYFNPLITKDSAIKANNFVLKDNLLNCSKKPTEQNPDGFATTFIFTSNYPSRVLGPNSKTDINASKCTAYGILPPSGQDMEDVIKHYLEVSNKIIDEQQKVGNKKVKKVDIENFNLKKFVEKYGPNENDGAYSNDAIAHIVPKATELYIDQPEKGFSMAFLRMFKYSMKDITPEKLKKYTKELQELNLAEKPKEKIDANLPKKEQLELRISNLKEFQSKSTEKWTPQMEARLQKFINEYNNIDE